MRFESCSKLTAKNEKQKQLRKIQDKNQFE